jgi:hypothetical protein
MALLTENPSAPQNEARSSMSAEAKRVLHVVFTPSAAPDLRTALARLGRKDEVVALADNLSFGPIDPPDPMLRARWIEDVLGYDADDFASEVAAFWTKALSDCGRRIVWTSRRSTAEYAGFLELVSRLGHAPCELVDVTELMVAGRDRFGERTPSALAGSVALLLSYQIVELGLVDAGQELTADMRAHHRETWRRLRAENAALRVLRPDLALVSAPISYFDPLLLSCADQRWRKSAYVVAKALSSFADDDLYQTGDIVLASRLRALVDAGKLEGAGDISLLQHSEVRLPEGPGQPEAITA